MEFKSCSQPTVGVEWELQLLDSKSLDLVDGILPLMHFFPDSEFVKPEYIQPCVELTSCISVNSEQAIEHIQISLEKVLKRCEQLDMAACGSGTHPFCRKLAIITPLDRYLRMEKKAGYLAHTQITFSTHVHIGMKSGNDAIRVQRSLTSLLPIFIALSANSPFWRGHRTGHASYRPRILAASPNYGLPRTFLNWQEYSQFYKAATYSGMIESFKEIHWDIRIHPDFGTIEIRVMDSAPNLLRLKALVAFTRVLVVYVSKTSSKTLECELPINLPRWILKENAYRASHQGLKANIIVSKNGKTKPLQGLTEKIFRLCKATAKSIDEEVNFQVAKEILTKTSAFSNQLNCFHKNSSTYEVTAQLIEQLKRL